MERFEVLRTLGAGGGGRVLLAKEKENGKHIAIKEIILDPKRKTKTKEAVQKEASILGQLKHPHIVTLLDSFLDKFEERLYIVQDYCDGGTLHDQVTLAKKNNMPLEEHQIMQWFVQVAMAVHHIHSKKILHRDLKSQNVFLTKKGIHSVVRLGDFGIARMMENTIDMAQTCCGTPCYLSPELCQDIPYSSKADVWALGCLLYEMCALCYAFDANNIVSLFYKIVKGEPGDIPSQYSSSIREVIQLMLSKSTEERPSAGAILNLPFIQTHLTKFIEEKENLQEALHARHHLKISRKTPAIPGRPSSAGDAAKPTTGECAKKNNKQRAKSAHPLSKIQAPVPQNDATEKGEGDMSNQKVEEEAAQSSDYSDDFDESEDEAYSDDFDEDPAMNGSLKQPLPPSFTPTLHGNGGTESGQPLPPSFTPTPHGNGGTESGQPLPPSFTPSPHENGGTESGINEVEYPDDFEEDSDEEEALDTLLANARAAQDAEEEGIVEEDSPISCRERLREHVIGALGEKVFEEMRERCERSRKEGNVPSPRSEFGQVSGSELMETCYLVEELFIGSNPEGATTVQPS